MQPPSNGVNTGSGGEGDAGTGVAHDTEDLDMYTEEDVLAGDIITTDEVLIEFSFALQTLLPSRILIIYSF